ncbi:helix-turn-helix domain-containing protein [Phaeodactylibacter xiamenensis]|uniref:helix-turn-helix domain-containing protein n=1 Tax=Phaeodactylibacter xiamenensis TaxID=1524460 RepID=UPI003CCB878E
MKHENFLKDTIDTHEACKLLGVSRTTLYRARKAGILKAVKMGRFFRYEKTEIDRFIKAMTINDHSEKVAA